MSAILLEIEVSTPHILVIANTFNLYKVFYNTEAPAHPYLGDCKYSQTLKRK